MCVMTKLLEPKPLCLQVILCEAEGGVSSSSGQTESKSDLKQLKYQTRVEPYQYTVLLGPGCCRLFVPSPVVYGPDHVVESS